MDYDLDNAASSNDGGETASEARADLSGADSDDGTGYGISDGGDQDLDSGAGLGEVDITDSNAVGSGGLSAEDERFGEGEGFNVEDSGAEGAGFGTEDGEGGLPVDGPGINAEGSDDNSEGAGLGNDDGGMGEAYTDPTSYEQADSGGMPMDVGGLDALPLEEKDAVEAADSLTMHGWMQRTGQLFSGTADWASGTATGIVHMGEYGWDSVTGDSAGADRHYHELLEDTGTVLHGLGEIAEVLKG